MSEQPIAVIPHVLTSGNHALVQPHREGGVWVRGRWRFIYDLCGGPPPASGPPAGAADHARLHLLAVHDIRPSGQEKTA